MSYTPSGGGNFQPYGTISPLRLQAESSRQNHSSNQSRSSGSRRSSDSHPAHLKPGAVHSVLYRPTPGSVLEASRSSESEASPSSYQERLLRYMPRIPEHIGVTGYSPIVFSVGGVVGPYMYDILKHRVVLDDADGFAVHDIGIRTIVWRLDWPGFQPKGRRISTTIRNKPITRYELAREICAEIGMILQNVKECMEKGISAPYLLYVDGRWRPDRVRFKDLRIVSLNFYRTVWIPVLALDA